MIYKLGKERVEADARPSSEMLFTAACRSLAYSIHGAALDHSPLEALRRRRDGVPGSDPAEVSRRKYLQQVARVLRSAAAQCGLGSTVSLYVLAAFAVSLSVTLDAAVLFILQGVAC